jgi:hypothetical protein
MRSRGQEITSGEPAETIQTIESLVLTIRGVRVLLDSDLARIYGVSTGRLNQALKRNLSRFPADFAFRLGREEFFDLLSQSVIENHGRGGRQTAPWVFNERGAIMLASVLNSPVAIEASVLLVRAFVYLREQLAVNRDLAGKFTELEKRLDSHDESIGALFEAIRRLIEPDESPRREIGFRIREAALPYRFRFRR